MRAPTPLGSRTYLPLSPRGRYRVQRVVVGGMFRVMEGLLQAASETDPVVADEVSGFPDGLVIGMSVIGATPRMRLRVRGGRLVRERADVPCDLEVIFKHLAHAFGVVTFQESTPRAFANDRMLTAGDIALTMRLTRCLDRMQAIALPRAVAARALKQVPVLPRGEKTRLVLATYRRLASVTLRPNAS